MTPEQLDGVLGRLMLSAAQGEPVLASDAMWTELAISAGVHGEADALAELMPPEQLRLLYTRGTPQLTLRDPAMIPVWARIFRRGLPETASMLPDTRSADPALVAALGLTPHALLASGARGLEGRDRQLLTLLATPPTGGDAAALLALSTPEERDELEVYGDVYGWTPLWLHPDLPAGVLDGACAHVQANARRYDGRVPRWIRALLERPDVTAAQVVAVAGHAPRVWHTVPLPPGTVTALVQLSAQGDHDPSALLGNPALSDAEGVALITGTGALGARPDPGTGVWAEALRPDAPASWVRALLARGAADGTLLGLRGQGVQRLARRALELGTLTLHTPEDG